RLRRAPSGNVAVLIHSAPHRFTSQDGAHRELGHPGLRRTTVQFASAFLPSSTRGALLSRPLRQGPAGPARPRRTASRQNRPTAVLSATAPRIRGCTQPPPPHPPWFRETPEIGRAH